MSDLRILSDAELDLVSGGMDPNYKQCPMGTTAGGPPGVYPNSATCSSGFLGDVAAGILAGAHKALHQQ